jgi:hypothetical protein
VRRRVLIATAVAVGVGLALTATLGASAYWSARRNLTTTSLSTGELRVSAVWDTDGNFGPFYPGSAQDRTITVTSAGSAGTTLGWRLAVSSAGQPDYYTFQAWEGPCGTGTLIPTATVRAPGASVSVCVRYTLSTAAPAAAQSSTLTPTLTITATQAHP